MRKDGLRGRCWPTELQEQMLRAAVLEPDLAAAAWETLRPGLVLDDIWDPQVHHLLPQIRANLVAAGIDDPDLPRLKGIHRRHWYENQMRLHRARPALERLEAAGIPVLFLKGVPLALAYFGDIGLRPMGDIDVLVHPSQADAALDILEADGWVQVLGLPRAQQRRIHHGAGLRHPEQGELDLHWDLGAPLQLPGDVDGSSDDLWAAAVPLLAPEHGIDALTLCPTDMLLHVIVHGMWAGSSATVRWVSDASTLLRHGGVDWDRFVDQARRRRTATLAGDALRYLVDEMRATVPSSVITTLQADPESRRERRLQRVLTGPIDGPDVLGGLPYLRSSWAYTRVKWGPAQAARELPGFIVQLWELESAWQIPAGAIARARRRVATRHGVTPAGVGTKTHTLAVVVPTHQRPLDLAECLAALARQTDPPEQIVVVRGHDDDAAAAVISQHPEVTEVVVPGRTVVERIHAGSAVTTTDLVAFTDDDAAPHPDWVRRLRTHFADASVGAAGGRDVQPGRAPDPLVRVGAIHPWGRVVGHHSHGEGAARDVDHLRGVNMAFRRRLLQFPVGLRGPGAQGYNEVALCLAVRASGHRVIYDPAILVDHRLAPRLEYGGHDRARPSRRIRLDDAYNQTYILLSYHPRRRWLLAPYVTLLGDRSTGGLGRALLGVATGERYLARDLVPLLRTQREAWRAWRSQPLRSVGPDEPFPDP